MCIAWILPADFSCIFLLNHYAKNILRKTATLYIFHKNLGSSSTFDIVLDSSSFATYLFFRPRASFPPNLKPPFPSPASSLRSPTLSESFVLQAHASLPPHDLNRWQKHQECSRCSCAELPNQSALHSVPPEQKVQWLPQLRPEDDSRPSLLKPHLETTDDKPLIVQMPLFPPRMTRTPQAAPWRS